MNIFGLPTDYCRFCLVFGGLRTLKMSAWIVSCARTLRHSVFLSKFSVAKFEPLWLASAIIHSEDRTCFMFWVHTLARASMPKP